MIEVLKQALEALEYPLNTSHEGFDVDMAELLSHRAITSLKQSIEQAQKQQKAKWILVPRNATNEMLKAMDECSTEEYDERLYAGHAASVYMAAVDATPLSPQIEKQKPVTLPCCGYANPEAVKWNPFNQVVQCHNCGHTYTPQFRKPLTLEHLRLYWKHAKVFDELHVDVGFPDYVLLVRDTESQHFIGE
jgi:hypothetical protein